MDTLYHHRRGMDMPYYILCIRCQDAQRGKNNTEIILESRSFLDGFSCGKTLKNQLAYAIIEI